MLLLVGFTVIGSRLGFFFRHFVFLVQHAPFKDTAEICITCIDWPIFKVLVIDSVNQRDSHCSSVIDIFTVFLKVKMEINNEQDYIPVQVNWIKKRWQPIETYFAMGIQKKYYFSSCFLCSSSSCSNQPFAFFITN